MAAHAGRYFEDYVVGETGVTEGRTVTEGDIHSFGYITGDLNQVHVNAEFAKASLFGRPIAQGLCTASIATGLLHLYAPFVLGLGANGLRMRALNVRYVRPALIGDTVSVRWRVKEKLDDEKNSHLGLLRTEFRIFNQAAEPLADGDILTSVNRKTPPSGMRAPALDSRTFARDVPGRALPDYSRVYGYDDYFPGLGDITGCRTITEADVVRFCGLSGNFHPLYLDRVFARSSGLEGTIVPELLVSGIAFGFLHRDAPVLMGNKAARLGGGHLSDRFAFLLPIRVGDSLFCYWEIVSVRESRSMPGRGIVTFRIDLVNQRDEIVQEGEVTVLRPKALRVEMTGH